MESDSSNPYAVGGARFVVARWQAYRAEARANLLRIVAIGVFYLVHLWSYYSSQGKVPNFGLLQLAEKGAISSQFHIEITLISVAWVMIALGVFAALQNRIFPTWMPYCTTGADIALLTVVLCVSSGPRSPLIAAYFLILILAALRLNLRLVWCATAGCALAYFVLLGCTKWAVVRGLSAESVPRYYEVIVLVAIALAGIMLGQIIRASWQLIDSSRVAK